MKPWLNWPFFGIRGFVLIAVNHCKISSGGKIFFWEAWEGKEGGGQGQTRPLVIS